MKNVYPLRNGGKWFKGNLHCHSTNSDGKLPPEQVARLYKENGWNFLAFTEHEHYTHNKELNDSNFIIIPGVEWANEKLSPLRIYHVLGIGREACGENNGFKHGQRLETRPWEGLKGPQACIDGLVSGNNLAVFCHPNWSRMELSDFIDLNGFFAMEIYNHGCEVESRTGLCIDYWDSLLRRGRKVWGVATDDAHHVLNDRCGGWIMVNCSELTQKNIIDALVQGSFYSSSGPEIYEFAVENGEVRVECSPVKAIHFVTYESFGYSCLAEGDHTISSAAFKLRGTEKYVRVECIDQSGKTAWTNPIFFNAEGE